MTLQSVKLGGNQFKIRLESWWMAWIWTGSLGRHLWTWWGLDLRTTFRWATCNAALNMMTDLYSLDKLYIYNFGLLYECGKSNKSHYHYHITSMQTIWGAWRCMGYITLVVPRFEGLMLIAKVMCVWLCVYLQQEAIRKGCWLCAYISKHLGWGKNAIWRPLKLPNWALTPPMFVFLTRPTFLSKIVPFCGPLLELCVHFQTSPISFLSIKIYYFHSF